MATMTTTLRLAAVWLLVSTQATAFIAPQQQSRNAATTQLNLFGPSGAKVPTSPNERDSMAIGAIKAAINKPKTPGFGLIECEFPPLAALNRLGDGSLRSAKEVDTANLAFAKKLVSGIAPLPMMGPKVWLLMSASAPGSLVTGAKKAGGTLHSLRDGLPEVAKSDVCVLLSPSSRPDYEAAQRLASKCKAVVLVNGFAKDTKSVPERATMAYFLKPLTYNSQVVGFLQRTYPGAWLTIDGTTKQILNSKDDSEILVQFTNTPDLRDSGRLVQKAVDERAIKARQQQ